MRIAVVGLGLIGGSMALALRPKHEVVAHDAAAGARAWGAERGIVIADGLDGIGAVDAVIVATPLPAIVATVEALVPRVGSAVILETGSLKRAVADHAEQAPPEARIVGIHPMAGSTASGSAAADPAIFEGRPFLVVPTARSDERAMALAGDIARELGGVVTVCSADRHDRAVAMLSGVPLAVAIALARAGEDVAHLAGPGFEGATRLAATPHQLAAALLGGTHVKDALARFRAALDEVERGL